MPWFRTCLLVVLVSACSWLEPTIGPSKPVADASAEATPAEAPNAEPPNAEAPNAEAPNAEARKAEARKAEAPPDYVLGPGDRIQVFVWRNPELGVTIPVRPDGKISIPLVEDMVAAGKRPTELARAIEQSLSAFIEDPIVTVIATEFGGEFDQQVRVIGEAARPQAIAYKARMTVLDVMIKVGGLTQFAAGNRSVIVRHVGDEETTIPVNLSDLLHDGRLENNVPVKPGDVIIIPQSLF